MRILHVAEAFGGGLMEMVHLIARRGAEAGHDSLVLYARRPETPSDPRAIFDPSIALHEVDWRRRAPLTQIAVARQLRALVADWRPDVVHLHSSFAGVVGAAALGGRAPLVYTPHAFASALPNVSGPRRRAFRTLERYAVRRCDLVGAVSDSEAVLARTLGAARVEVVPNGIPELDHPDEIDRPVFDGRPRVIALGRVIAQRQPEACARILGAVADRADVRWIGGGGDPGPAGEAALAALEQAGVEVTGWMQRHRVLGELTRASVYLHWTSWDGQALSILEALACGALVVASDIPPNRELLDPRQVADTEEAAGALIRRILDDPGFAAELRAAQEEIRRRHSARGMVSSWLELYASLQAELQARS